MKLFAVSLLAFLIAGVSAQDRTLHGRLAKPPDGNFYIDAVVPVEGTYEIQRSNLLPPNGWTIITNFTTLPGTVTVQEAMGGASRFYRLAQLTNPPVITSQPQGSTNYTPIDITLSVSVIGSAPLRLQWYRDGQIIDNATSTNLTFTGRFDLSGDYTVIITNFSGSVTSSVATVKFNPSVALSISGKTIRYEIELGVGDFLSSGNFTTVYDPSGFYSTTGSSVLLNDTGYWFYGIVDDHSSRIAIPGSVAFPDGIFTLVFKVPTTEGNFHLAVPGMAGYQIGKFKFLN